MDDMTLLGIAVGLAMDAFAVSITAGAFICVMRIKSAMKVGVSFGIFQFMMPVAGWLLAITIKSFITGVDHWIAFALLGFVGGRMIYESFKMEETKSPFEVLSFRWLIALGIATSIDALIIGVTFAFLDTSIVIPAIVIGIVAFTFSFAGFFIGCRLGHLFEGKIEVFGGIILIGIGLKILLEHLFF